MYRLLKIIEDDATRFLKLNNLETNIIDDCFDDSALVSNNNFDFMKVGQKYDCKIKLFGKPLDSKKEGCLTCIITNNNVTIGNKDFTEVLVNKNKYYVSQSKAQKYSYHNRFYFYCTRKELIQVNEVIHADLI